MAAEKLLKDLYAVGIEAPGLRVFDIVMATEYGTSYNSYLLRGSATRSIFPSTGKTSKRSATRRISTCWF